VLKTAFLHHTSAPATDEQRQIITEILSRESDLAKTFLSDIASLANPGIDRIVVTAGPGLEPALWVGINFARALGVLWSAPVFPVNHMEGHILAALFDPAKSTLPSIAYPAIALLISGGHTELVRVDAIGTYTLLGETQDDAVGECFDKVARMLGLPYPGGPEISRIAQIGTAGVYPLPRPMLHSGNLHFSFSGLKTSVLYLIKKLGDLSPQIKADIAREFEEAVTETLTSKSQQAITDTSAQALIVGGGVSANTRIRAALQALCDTEGIPFFAPSPTLSTDNALMIALAGSMITHEPPSTIVASGNWKIHPAG
jgi:N6-L-threonylcarbamoyladenine synthase